MSNTTKHTPGPWEAVQLGGRASIIDEINGLPIADFYDRTNGEFHNEAYANAIVSAAAPELLDALVSLTDHLYDAGFLGQDFPNEWKTVKLPPLFNKAMLAIKKAQP